MVDLEGIKNENAGKITDSKATDTEADAVQEKAADAEETIENEKEAEAAKEADPVYVEYGDNYEI